MVLSTGFRKYSKSLHPLLQIHVKFRHTIFELSVSISTWVSQEADSEVEISIHKVYWSMPWNQLMMKGREVGLGSGKS